MEGTGTSTPEKARAKKAPWQVKVYLVCQMDNLAPAGAPNVRVLSAKLTRAAAEDIHRRTPGTYIVRMLATK